MTALDTLENLRASRAFFLKHLKNLTDDQWTWKPYPECKSIVETVAHLIADDRAALDSLASGREPDYEKCQVAEEDRGRLLAMLDESHSALLEALAAAAAGKGPDAEVCAWGWKMPLLRAVGLFSSEDYYHAGQVGFIRVATDPKWDYYADIYGPEPAA